MQLFTQIYTPPYIPKQITVVAGTLLTKVLAHWLFIFLIPHFDWLTGSPLPTWRPPIGCPRTVRSTRDRNKHKLQKTNSFIYPWGFDVKVLLLDKGKINSKHLGTRGKKIILRVKKREKEQTHTCAWRHCSSVRASNSIKTQFCRAFPPVWTLVAPAKFYS